MIAYRAMLDVPRELAQYVSRPLHAERRRRGTRRNSRALTCFRQAVPGLRWFRQNAEVTALARDHGVSRANGYRYLDEVINVLAGQAPDLHDALDKTKADGLEYVILDGKIFSADRCSEKPLSVKGKQIDLWYAGKAREPGGNVQALSGPDGLPRWEADVEPGSVHDLTVAREPTAATKARASARTPRSNNPPVTKNSTSTAAPTTPCSAACAASANADSPSSPAAGEHHHQPQQDRPHRQSRSRPHPFRTRPTHLKVAYRRGYVAREGVARPVCQAFGDPERSCLWAPRRCSDRPRAGTSVLMICACA